MKIFPRALATLALAVAAVPGIAPLASADQTPAHVPTPVPMIPAPAPGGWTHQNPSSPDVRLAASFAVTALGQEFGQPYVVERIRSAESQVVEGENFRIRMRIAENQDSILGARKDCTVVVWWRPWMHPTDILTSFTCQAVDH